MIEIYFIERGYIWTIKYSSITVPSPPSLLFMYRLLLWDCDNRSYSYYVEVSGNSWNWILVADKTTEACRSWQTIRFHPPRPVVFIRIVGTHNTANEVGGYMYSSFHA